MIRRWVNRLKKAIVAGAVTARLRPRPIAEIRARGYRDIEPGVREFVRQLDEASYVPVWSCEGHRKWNLPPTWHDGPVWRRLTKSGIAWWRRPRVICVGPWFVDRRRMGIRGIRFIVADIRVRRPGCSIMRALPQMVARAEDLDWMLFVELGPGQIARAMHALREGDNFYVRTP